MNKQINIVTRMSLSEYINRSYCRLGGLRAGRGFAKQVEFVTVTEISKLVCHKVQRCQFSIPFVVLSSENSLSRAPSVEQTQFTSLSINVCREVQRSNSLNDLMSGALFEAHLIYSNPEMLATTKNFSLHR